MFSKYLPTQLPLPLHEPYRHYSTSVYLSTYLIFPVNPPVQPLNPSFPIISCFRAIKAQAQGFAFVTFSIRCNSRSPSLPPPLSPSIVDPLYSVA